MAAVAPSPLVELMSKTAFSGADVHGSVTNGGVLALPVGLKMNISFGRVENYKRRTCSSLFTQVYKFQVQIEMLPQVRYVSR